MSHEHRYTKFSDGSRRCQGCFAREPEEKVAPAEKPSQEPAKVLEDDADEAESDDAEADTPVQPDSGSANLRRSRRFSGRTDG